MPIPMITIAIALPRTAMVMVITAPTILGDHILLDGIHHPGMIQITHTVNPYTIFITTTSNIFKIS